ncbi:hypothetical protein NDN08_000011 [Rhodosorus marinus]|uniref:Signal peptidase complex subunit 1 n=1 Tax=Rhodosorus marinus TaxID=101924 RepID=A0AAV8UE07_9RHOD|nr:hypothetical protein NDN08_000011 [Rhodosorus marinus]
MDLKGQQRSERYFVILMTAVTAVAFLAGYVVQDLRISMAVFTGGVVVGFIVSMPNWPIYKVDPLVWAKAEPPVSEHSDATSETSSTTAKTPRKKAPVSGTPMKLRSRG